jgi:hypothetical protein
MIRLSNHLKFFTKEILFDQHLNCMAHLYVQANLFEESNGLKTDSDLQKFKAT